MEIHEEAGRSEVYSSSATTVWEERLIFIAGRCEDGEVLRMRLVTEESSGAESNDQRLRNT